MAEPSRSTHPPLLSVVVPVHAGGERFRDVLSAIRSSDPSRGSLELIVVDDASGDDSAEVAAASADLVIRLRGRPRGPAYARNRGFEASRGIFVAFIDADVLVRPDALTRMLGPLRQDPSVGAVVGSYDGSRSTGGPLSEYRNLLRHLDHSQNVGDTDTFAAGLSVVRRDAFVRAGMFDEWRFPRPQAEALEFGDRLRALGYRIMRPQGAEGTHLKSWTVLPWIRFDLLDRGMSIARLNQSREFRARAGRLYLATPVDGLLAWTAATSGALAAWRGGTVAAVVSLGSVLVLGLRHASLFAAFWRARGIAFTIAVAPIHFVTCAITGFASALGRILYYAIGEPQPDPVTQAYAEVGVRTWPPVPSPTPTLAGTGERNELRTSARS